jgi:hemoglobin
MISLNLSTLPENSLFARLGGASSIDAAVEQFYGRLLEDPQLRDFYAQVNMTILKKHGKDLFSTAWGGLAID